MVSEMIVAGLALLGTVVGSGLGVLASAKLTNWRTQKLEEAVREHNNFARRLPVVEEQIKVMNHRVSDLEEAVE